MDITRCIICNRTLTDPASVARGYGPECAARFATQVAEQGRLAVGTTVTVISGSYAGETGEVLGYNTRPGKRNHRPVLVSFGRYTGKYTADQLEVA